MSFKEYKSKLEGDYEVIDTAAGRVYVARKSKGWKTKEVKEPPVTCSLCSELDIFLEYTPRKKLKLLMEEFTDKEWMGYLVGLQYDEGICVTDLVIPPHEESNYSSAEAEPFNIPDDCVGVIHSHHKMGAFHSGTDHDHVDSNFPCSITVAVSGGKLEFSTVAVIHTPCGKVAEVTPKLVFVDPPPTFPEEEWFEEAVTNVKKGQWSYKHPTTVQPTTAKGWDEDEYLERLYAYAYGASPPKEKSNGWGKNLAKETTPDSYLPLRYRVADGGLYDENNHEVEDGELLALMAAWSV